MDKGYPSGKIRGEVSRLYMNWKTYHNTLISPYVMHPIIKLIAPEYSDKVESLLLTEGRDTIIWRWYANGGYTTRSSYGTVMGGSIICDRCVALWKFKVSPTVRIFWFLLLKDRLLTYDNMQRRNMRCMLPCGLCGIGLSCVLSMSLCCAHMVHSEQQGGL